MSQIDDYLATTATPTQRRALERVRQIAKKFVSDAEETISYGMPTLKYNGKYLIYFAAFKDHMSVFPGSALTAKLQETLGGRFKLHKGTIQFTEDNPLPESVIKQIVTARLKAIKNDKTGYERK